MGDSLAPGNAHIVRIVPLGYENKVIEQDNASKNDFIHEQERVTAISENDFMHEQEGMTTISENDFMHEQEGVTAIYENDFMREQKRVTAISENNFMHELERMTAISENDFMHEQERVTAISENDSVNEQERKSAISKNEEVTKEEEHYPLIEEEFAQKIPETEIVTYLVCDADQQLPILSQDFSVVLSDSSQLKEASTISNIIQASPIMSKIVQIESNVDKDELKRAEMLYKISMLESKIEKFREQRGKDKRKIKALMQSQRRNLKKIASLKESVTVLKQHKYITHAKSEILKKASPSLLEILGEKKCQNKDKTDSRRHSLAVCDFVRNLYSISPDAYKYVRNYFGTSLPSEEAVSKWINKKSNELHISSEEDSDDLNSFDGCVDMRDLIDEDEDIEQDNGQEINIQSTSESFLSL